MRRLSQAMNEIQHSFTSEIALSGRLCLFSRGLDVVYWPLGPLRPCGLSSFYDLVRRSWQGIELMIACGSHKTG